MRQLLFISSVLLIFQLGPVSASNSEVGLLLGVMSYKGELNPHLLSTDFSTLHPAAGIYWRRNWNPHFSYRLNFIYGHVSGDDSHQSSGFANARNLSFYSPVYELANLFEFNFFPYDKYGSPYLVTPYVFTGLSVFYFNPNLYYKGKLYELQKLELEGQKYSKYQLALPMGVGMKARLGYWNLNIEIGPRKTSTDYLDNVSKTYLAGSALTGAAQVLANPSADSTAASAGLFGRKRGTATDKDWYLFFGFSFSRKIGDFRRHDCQRILKDQ